MSAHNKVVWSEGLFLRPQHFQQQERYLERFVETRCQSLVPYSWGFADIEIERDLLGISKFGLRRATGVFPDGTPLRLPDDDPLPAPLDVGANIRDQIVYLGIPLRRAQALDVDRGTGGDELARHHVREHDARDVTGASADAALLEVGALRTRFLLAADVTAAYACIPLAHIVERRADGQVVLDESFIPTVLHAGASARLATFMKELLGLLRQRGQEYGARAAATGRGGTAEIGQFLMLQAINRYEPIVAHFADGGVPHPEELYRLCAAAAGELATFTSEAKRPPLLASYRHDRLRESFDPVIVALRKSLSDPIVDQIVPIPIETRKFGIRLATVPDRNLYSAAVFVLAARADMPAEELRRMFPAQVKIGPAETIGNLVNLALPGIPVTPVPVAPRQIPFNAGFVYFEFDQTHELWGRLKTSGGIGMFIGEGFPNLALELWAIYT
jgi:type VI secretion system protein ImpJ